MKISLISAKALTSDLKEKWSFLQESDPAFASPFFCPEFTSSLALYCDDIYVACMEEDADIVGFFPFRLGKYSIAKPMYMCGYQGVIVRKGVPWKIDDLLKGCGLVGWDFFQLVAPQATLQKTDNLNMTACLIINLSNGYEAYIEELKKVRSEQMKKLFRAIKKIEQEVGPLNFKEDISDTSILHKILEWKVAKYNELSYPKAWVAKTLEDILATRTKNFRGMLSALYAGEELVAAHFGIVSGNILQWWFPAYNEQFKKYSPGIILLLRVAQDFSLHGGRIIDLGSVRQDYKVHLSNNSIPVGEGCFEIPSALTSRRRLFRQIKRFLRKSPYLYISLQKAYRNVRSIGS